MRGSIRATLGGLSILLAGPGCKPAATGELPICAAEVAGGAAREAEAQSLPPEVWFSILLDGFDRAQMLAGPSPRDCTGAAASAPTPPPRADAPDTPVGEAGEAADPDASLVVAGCSIADPPELEPLPAAPLTEADLHVSPGPTGTSLVWVKALRHANGDASGPVAVVEWTPAGVAVRALGRLRAPTEANQLRIERAGELRLLVAEGDRCPGQGRCQRVIRLLPIVDGRIATVPLVLADAPEGAERCLGEAAFATHERHVTALPDGRERRFEIVRSLRFDSDRVAIREQVVIDDADPSQPDAPAEPFRQAASERPLSYRGRWFEAPASIWDDLLADHGSVAATEAGAAPEADAASAQRR